MKRNYSILAVALLLAVSSRAGMQELSFYDVQPASRPVVIDGHMSDALWADATAHTNYYEYFKSEPKRGAIRTEFRMLYTQSGLYLGIRNFDDNMGALRKKITDRGNSKLWTDDCAEIYFEGNGHGGGYRCFKVNAIGTTSEINQLDAAVTVGEWEGTGWFVKTSVQADQWIIEGFFPWDDIGTTCQAGDILRFCHVRYAYTSGTFIGVTSAAGGSYASPHSFGYLYFNQGHERLETKTIAQILSASATPPWGLALGDTLISDRGTGPLIELMKTAIGDAVTKLRELDVRVTEGLKTATNKRFDTDYAKLAPDVQALLEGPGTDFSTLQNAESLLQALENLWIRMKLDMEFN